MGSNPTQGSFFLLPWASCVVLLCLSVVLCCIVSKHLRIRTIFRSDNTLRHESRPQTRIEEDVVYQIPCLDYNRVYREAIGETGERAQVCCEDCNNGVAVHAWDSKHRVDWDGMKILSHEPHY